ncbi:MAG: MFS transporter [Actinomycetota bacterium]|nr:MFS transporter [Actinomycetota bacterium]MDQ6935698.1 MFS transporter [Actinomycetota bacterium]
MSSRPRPSLASFWHDLPREGKLLLSVVVFEFIGTGLVLPFAVIYLHQVRHFSLADAGLLLGVPPLAGVLAVGPGGALIDKAGARRVLVGSLVAFILGEVMMAFAASELLAAVALTLVGLAFGTAWPASQSMIAMVVPSEIRQRYFGVNFSLLNLGIGIGGIASGLFVDVHRLVTFQTIYLFDAVSFLPSLYLLLVPLRHVSGLGQHDPETEDEKVSYLAVARRPAMLSLTVLTFVSAFVGYAQLNAGMPAFASAVAKVSTRGLGFAFAANTLVIVLLQLVVLQRIEGRRRTRVITVMAVVWATSWALLGCSGLVPGTLGATLLVGACASVFALGETLLQPTIPAMVNELAPDHLRGRYNALTSGAFNLASILGPPFAGWMIGRQLSVLYVLALVLGCALVGLVAIGRLEPQLPTGTNGVRERIEEPEHLFD